MIFKILLGATAFLASEAEATYVNGKCPQVQGWNDIHPNQKFDPKRIRGFWGSAWENNIKMLSAECMSMKLQQIGNDPDVMKMYTGISWRGLEEVAYDDSMVLTFKDPEDPASAAITSVEDIKMNKVDASKFASFQMRPIPKDVEYRMDYQDVELYYQFNRELQMQKDQLQDSMDSGDRYKNNYRVLDTDYKDYLVMYRCRDEFRNAQQGDDLNPISEDFRQIMEDFDENKHPQLLANKTVQMAGPNESFKELVKTINGTKTAFASEDHLENEMNAFLQYENEGHLIFKDRTPNTEEWKRRRDNYLVTMEMPEMEEPKEGELDQQEELPKDKMWFHDMRLSVFLRKPFNVKDDKYKMLAEKVKNFMPAFYWDELTQYIEHKDENCIRGDIFKHPSAKKFEDLVHFDRGEAKQTQEMFDRYEEEHKAKIASGEIKDYDADDSQEELDAEEQEELEKVKVEMGLTKKSEVGKGSDKVNDMLSGMGMEMISEEDAHKNIEAKNRAKERVAERRRQELGDQHENDNDDDMEFDTEDSHEHDHDDEEVDDHHKDEL